MSAQPVPKSSISDDDKNSNREQMDAKDEKKPIYPYFLPSTAFPMLIQTNFVAHLECAERKNAFISTYCSSHS